MPHPVAIGNQAEEILFGVIAARKAKKKILILHPLLQSIWLGTRNANKELLELRSHHIESNKEFIKFFLNVIFTIYYIFWFFLSKFIKKLFSKQIHQSRTFPYFGQDQLWTPRQTSNIFSTQIVRQLEWEKHLNNDIDIGIDQAKELAGLKCAVELGIQSSDWYVCIHVRESGYWADIHTAAHRNANIENYIEAIEYIVSLGGKVVRMGDPSMNKLPEIKNVIDYPFSPYKSALMDLYLIKNCSLFIGMQSGLYDLANLFYKPIILTNMTGWLFAYPQKKGDLGIFKNMYCTKSKRFISLQERLDLGWEGAKHNDFNSQFEFYENTPDEILQVVKEYFSDTERQCSDLQYRFNEMRVKCGEMVLDNPIYRHDSYHDLQERYRIASRLSSAHGCIGLSYLESNWNFIG